MAGNSVGRAVQASVEKQTHGGTIRKSTIYPNAQMGTERDIAQAVRFGSLEMGAVGVALMNWVPDMSITDAPFLFRDRQQAYAALDGALGAELKRARSPGRASALSGWTDLGMRCMTNSKHPIHQVVGHARPEDAGSGFQILHRHDAGHGSDDGHGRSVRALPRLEPACRRRTGHAAVRRHVEQILRGAEIHLQDGPRADQCLRHHQPGLLQPAGPGEAGGDSRGRAGRDGAGCAPTRRRARRRRIRSFNPRA